MAESVAMAGIVDSVAVVGSVAGLVVHWRRMGLEGQIAD